LELRRKNITVYENPDRLKGENPVSTEKREHINEISETLHLKSNAERIAPFNITPVLAAAAVGTGLKGLEP
jgi:hypothetical protein